MSRFIICILLMLSQVVIAADPTPSPSPSRKPVKVYSLDGAFFGNLAASDPMRRDIILSSHLNSVIEGVAVVSKIEDKQQFKKSIRISANINQQKITFLLNIFTDNPDYKTLLEQGQKMSFRGQLVALTPLNTKRDSYMMDVILEDGAAVIE